MATRKRKKHTRPASRSIRELIRKAREQGHDTLGIMNDPESLGYLEFAILVRTLTERFTAAFERGRGPYTDAIGQFMWEPVAKCIVRAMIRKLCEGVVGTSDRCCVTYDDSGLYAVARHALDSIRTRLGDDWISVENDRFNRVAGVVADVFREPARFSLPAQLKCREVPYTFHRKDDVLNISRGGAR